MKLDFMRFYFLIKIITGVLNARCIVNKLYYMRTFDKAYDFVLSTLRAVKHLRVVVKEVVFL